MNNKLNIVKLQLKKGVEQITSLTAYDYTSAKILDTAGIDLVLVGDSLGMVLQGNETTLQVTLDEMIYHGKMVRKGLKNAFMVVDMPFGTYTTVEEGVKNAVRVIQQTGADAIKLEGANETVLEIISTLYENGVITMAHIGLQPQMYNVMGGYKVQGRDNFRKVVEDAVSVEKAGAKLIVLEGIIKDCAEEITKTLTIPTIGIGAGPSCDGQILVYHDIFGFFTDFCPKFVKRYANLGTVIEEAAKQYIKDVKENIFPAEEHTYKTKRQL